MISDADGFNGKGCPGVGKAVELEYLVPGISGQQPCIHTRSGDVSGQAAANRSLRNGNPPQWGHMKASGVKHMTVSYGKSRL